jgi:hypothetical protein
MSELLHAPAERRPRRHLRVAAHRAAVVLPDSLTLTTSQAALQARLVEALRVAVPEAGAVTQAIARADHAYRQVAEVLVELRHEFRTSNGQPDLQGRSPGYRVAVRKAYVRAGALGRGPIEKRLTAGVAYWVRKLLIEQYGEDDLYRLGVLKLGDNVVREPISWRQCRLPEDPEARLLAVVGLLNELAADTRVVPTAELMRSALRAMRLLKQRLDSTAP